MTSCSRASRRVSLSDGFLLRSYGSPLVGNADAPAAPDCPDRMGPALLHIQGAQMRYAVHKFNQRWHILDIEDGELIRDRRSRLVSYRAKISAENRVHELNGTLPVPGRYVLEAKGGFFYIRDMQVNKLVHDARGFLRVYANKARALSYMAKLNEGNADAEQAGE